MEANYAIPYLHPQPHSDPDFASRTRYCVPGGLLLFADQPPEQALRLRELRDLYAFFEAELPALLERWRNQRGRP